MAVMPREKWTDHRLDEFKENVDGGYARLETAINASAAGLETKMADGFARVDEKFAQVDEKFAEIDKKFEKVDERFDKVEGKIESGIKELRGEMNLRFQGLDARFDSLQRSLFAATIVIIAAFIGTNAL
jgi:chromosome segregation ATPase